MHEHENSTLTQLEMAMAPLQIEPVILRSTFWQATLLGFDFSGFLGALEKWLFGTIILSPDQLGPVAILWSDVTPTKT